MFPAPPVAPFFIINVGMLNIHQFFKKYNTYIELMCHIIGYYSPF